MEKTQTLRVKMQKISSKIQSNVYMSSISSGLSLLMGVLIAGAIFTLIDSVNVASYQNFLKTSGLKTITGIPATVTTNLISLYTVFAIAYVLAGKFKKDSFSAGLLALMSFLILTPMGPMADKSTGISTQWLGASGIFVAMLVSLLVGRLYVFILEKQFYIKMPKGVPPTVEKSFASIVPGIAITILMLALRAIFAATAYGNIHKFIYTLVQVPLTHLGGGWVAFLITTLASSILWFLGVHGGMVVYSVMNPIWTTMRVQNLEAFQKGAELPNLIPGGSFLSVYTNLGGSGATIGLAIALIFAASKRYKTLGKLTIIPGLLGINEPLMFGLPMVLNTKFLIPLIAAPLVNTILAIVATAMGIIPKLRGIGTPMGTPVVVRGFIEGGWRVAVFQAVLVVVSFLIYYPFFKKADAAALEEENKTEAKTTAVEA
jgi:cellobiose PTS system EIIC component